VTGTVPSVSVDATLPSGDMSAPKVDVALPSAGVIGPGMDSSMPSFKGTGVAASGVMDTRMPSFQASADDPIPSTTINALDYDVGGSFKAPAIGGRSASIQGPDVSGLKGPDVGGLKGPDVGGLKGLDVAGSLGGIGGDAGTLKGPDVGGKLPGLGGSLDRPDSASYTAPDVGGRAPGAGGSLTGPDLRASKPSFRGGPVPNLEGAFKNSDGHMQTVDGHVMTVGEYIDLQTVMGGGDIKEGTAQFGPHSWTDWTAQGTSGSLPSAQVTAPSGGISSGQALGAGVGLGAAAGVAGAAIGLGDRHGQPNVDADVSAPQLDGPSGGLDASGKPHQHHGFLSKIKDKLPTHHHGAEGVDVSGPSGETRMPDAGLSGPGVDASLPSGDVKGISGPSAGRVPLCQAIVIWSVSFFRAR
jgi:hypothetical protein